MRKKVILVIDDDEMNLQIAKMVLEKKLSCEVLTADNGVEGLDILRERRVNLVLLDVMMPDFDGIETLQEIRGDEQIKNVPVMMLTASVERETIQKAGALGVKDYIRKPFMPADLIARVKKKLDEEIFKGILLLGDDEKILRAMQEVVEENFPYETLTATTAEAAEKILREAEINLIIACADMKFIDGFKFLALAAGDENFNHIPFAVTTPEKILELVEKMNAPAVEEEPLEISEPPAVEEPPPIVEEVAEAVVVHEEKKKLAKVVTTFIGYKLDTKI
ncbi:MAG: response regulator [Selenomonadaceae bacterium]|nr:response regulator [Selenomonadaceae bacterium]